MTAIERELDTIRELTVSMMELVREQLKRSREALLHHDTRLAGMILREELKVNALELTIEKACEQVIALHQPVATELRFVLAVFKAVSELERLADHVEGIARVLIEKEVPFTPDILEKLETDSMFEESVRMFDEIICSLNDHDTELARSVFRRDKFLNKTFKRSTARIIKEMNGETVNSGELLRLFQVLYRLERIGDLLTNVAELIIFYLEAVMLKHLKKKKKMEKKIRETEPKPEQDNADRNL
jgi:phosphate transport system protein